MRVGTWVIAGVVLLGACAASEATPREMRQISKSYAFTIVPDQAPPHAREPVMYRILVRDRDTRQPIENGEGQIFATSREGASTWDGLSYGPQIGTYFGKVSFITPGECRPPTARDTVPSNCWAIAIRFRRDSLHPLERIDWMQAVLNERSSKSP